MSLIVSNSQYNLLIAADKIYYSQWAITFLKTLHYHVPWLSLHCHLVNSKDVEKLPYVNYTHEEIQFSNDDQKLGYLQAVRFLAVANKFTNNESVVVLDCDCLCVKPFTQDQFSKLFDQQFVLQYNKKDRRWMAGFVTFKDNEFRQAYAAELLKKPVEDWPIGWDQEVMKQISEKYKFVELSDDWMSLMKYNGKSYFFTGKGGKKFKQSFLERYNFFVNRDLKGKN